MTREEASQISAWEKSIKTNNAYKNLVKNIAFKDFLERIESWTKSAIDTINDKDTKEEERKYAFATRDFGFYVLGLFGESDQVLDNLERHIKAKTEEWQQYKK